MRNRLASISNDENQLMSYLKLENQLMSYLKLENQLMFYLKLENQLMSYLKLARPSPSQPTFSNHQSSSSTPTPPLLQPPIVSRRSASPTSSGSRDRSPSLGTGRDRSPSAGTVSSPPFVTVSAADDRATTSAVDAVESDVRSTEDRLQAPSAWDSGSGTDVSTAGGMQRPASLYSRRRTMLKAIREKSMSIDVGTPTVNDAIMPRN